MLSFIFIYSLFLSIPLPYLSQPPPRLLPYFPGPASTSAGRAGRCPDSRRCLSLSGVDAAPGHAAFSLFPPLEGIPSLSFSLSLLREGWPRRPLPVPGYAGRTEEQKSRTPPHPSTLGARRRPRCPCCPGASSRPGLPGLPARSWERKIGVKGALSGAGTGRLGRWCAGRYFGRGGVVAGGRGRPRGQAGTREAVPAARLGGWLSEVFCSQIGAL